MPEKSNPYATPPEIAATKSAHTPALGTEVRDGPWIQFDLVTDDIAEFNLHLLGRSRLKRAQNRRLIVVIAFATAPIVLLLFVPRVPWVIFLPFLFFVGLMILAQLLNRSVVRRNIRKLMSEADNQNMLGIQELQSTGKAIIHRSIACESRYLPTAFVRVDETPLYWFLFTSSIHAIIVPKRSIISGNANSVIDEVLASTN